MKPKTTRATPKPEPIRSGDHVILKRDTYLLPYMRLPAGTHVIVVDADDKSAWLHVMPTNLQVLVGIKDLELYRQHWERR